MPEMLVRAKVNDSSVITVTPMKPLKHDLSVSWYVERLPDDVTPAETPPPAAPKRDAYGRRSEAFARLFGRLGGTRGRADRSLYDLAPEGELSALATKKKLSPDAATSSLFALGKLKPGRWWITVVVKDPASEVLLDPKHLLEERASWPVLVTP
jgi:hypothetical protein